MKYFTIIFCFYLTALVLTPCSDKDECSELNTISYTFLSVEHQHHNAETETCTPFCICACCGQTFNTEYSVSLVGNVFLLGEITKKPEKIPFIKEVYFSIWQPPKIS